MCHPLLGQWNSVVQRVEVVGVGDKHQITAVFVVQWLVIFFQYSWFIQKKTIRCHPKYAFPSGWHITHSPKHWVTEATMLDYVETIIIPYVESIKQELDKNCQATLVIIDNFKHLLWITYLNITLILFAATKYDRSSPAFGRSSKQASKRFYKEEI